MKTMKPNDGGWSIWFRPKVTSAWVRVYIDDKETAAVATFERHRLKLLNGTKGELLLFSDRQFMAGANSAWYPV